MFEDKFVKKIKVEINVFKMYLKHLFLKFSTSKAL